MFQDFTTLQLVALLLAIFGFIAMAVQHFRYRSDRRRRLLAEQAARESEESRA